MAPRFYSNPSDGERLSHITDEDKAKDSRRLKNWRPDAPPPQGFLAAFNISGERHGIFSHSVSLKPSDWIAWYRRQQMAYLRWSQMYNPARQNALGNDLALATFLIHRNGKVKKKGMKRYLTKDDIPDLPTTFQPTWFVEAVDVSGTDICYEGIENFKNVHRLKKAAFRNCKHFDDWCLERVVALCENLEELDVSENQKITERGLEGLYRAWNLKKVIVTDWGHGAAFELTCLLLEDSNPELTVEIRKPSEKLADEVAGEQQKIQDKSENKEQQTTQ
uniref:Uncharacterized protein n=1 Tax=Bracon brevicornis TaxID=1563983 RepID=A0A6V7KWZ6_9HYME